MREAAPDMEKGNASILHLRIASQVLRDAGVVDPLPERLWRILRSIAADGRDEGGVAGSLGVRKHDAETVRVTLRRDWPALEETASRRREGSRRLLEHLLASLPAGSRGTDLLAETTLGKLLETLTSDLVLKTRIKNPEKLLDRALLWLHEQEVIRLHKGLAVFRPAMTIRLTDEKPRRGFASADFELLRLHYEGQVRQIHVMVEFARRGLEAMADALRLAMDYFGLNEEEFLHRWLPERSREIRHETTPESWRAIVESLKNSVQQRIVADDRDQTNVLILAGPGSGKTRVLVHRIAFLVRVRRENPSGILALAYNRHAAVEIRRRLRDLVGDDARRVTVLTCHGLAMRLAGASFSARAERPDGDMFQEVIRQAIGLLRGEGLPPEEADEQRDRFLAGFRWILVDEYQDIDGDQYELISALAGRTQEDEDRKLTVFAVGDDDQNIYAFNGASVEFIRRFEKDYGPKPEFLIDNYRSTGHIIAAANALIEPARERMKDEHSIRIDRARTKNPPGDEWSKLDSVAQGRVQVLSVPKPGDLVAQAQVGMMELLRLAGLAPDWDWSRCAVIAREWKYLEPVRAFCEIHGIEVQMGNEEMPNFWHLRETRALVKWLRERETKLVDGMNLRGWVNARPYGGPWIELLREALDEHALEAGESVEVPVDHFIEWLAEWGTGSPPQPAWTDASKRAPSQGIGVRPCGRARRRLGQSRCRQGGRSGRAPQTLLRGHDPCPEDPRARAFSGSTAAARPHPAELCQGACPSGVLGGGTTAICLSEQRLDYAARLRRPAAGNSRACTSIPAAPSGRGIRRASPRQPSGASRHRRPVARGPAGGTSGRTGTLESAGQVRYSGRAPCQRLRTPTGDKVRLRQRPRPHSSEPRSIGAGVPRLRAMRNLGGSGAGVGVRTGAWVIWHVFRQASHSRQLNNVVMPPNIPGKRNSSGS